MSWRKRTDLDDPPKRLKVGSGAWWILLLIIAWACSSTAGNSTETAAPQVVDPPYGSNLQQMDMLEKIFQHQQALNDGGETSIRLRFTLFYANADAENMEAGEQPYIKGILVEVLPSSGIESEEIRFRTLEVEVFISSTNSIFNGRPIRGEIFFPPTNDQGQFEEIRIDFGTPREDQVGVVVKATLIFIDIEEKVSTTFYISTSPSP